jgi:signal transduction histidine kinase/DNA-binding response OmpR family regulator
MASFTINRVSELPPPGSVALVARALEAMADGVVVADTVHGDVHVNSTARAMLGLPADGPVTTSFLKDRLGFYPFDLVAAGGGPVREEVRIGEALYHSVVSPIIDETGAPVGAIVVLRDLGETRAALRQRAEFASQVSHELRTPLTSVAGALDIVLSGYAGTLSEKQQRYVEMARQAASRMNSLIDQLLEAARAGSGRISLVRSRMDVGTLVRDVVERYRDVARAKPAQLTTRITTKSAAIEGDGERLAQVLGNLLSNSIKFAPPGGVVDVEVFAPAGVASVVGVSVYNDGEQIPEEERERIFDPFETSGRRVGGSGLGLGISRAIVEAHGGRIWVEAGASGTKFVFTLPTAPVMLATGTTPPPVERRSTQSDVTARVLVVDGDRHGAYLLKGLLMAAGHNVEVAHDADAALAVAREIRPQLVVVSGAMPDATALVAIVEHDPDTRNAVVLAVCDPTEHADMTTAGAAEVVARPVQPTELIAAASRVIADASRRHRQRVLVVDDDPSIRAICREVLEQSGFLVRDAGSADAALAEARRFRPDLILLDVMMPIVDGFRTAEYLRADGATAMTPLIFLSAKGETADKVRAFRSGAEDYIVKPFDSAELVARVAKALERQARELGASPTTQLPGTDAIEAELNRRLTDKDRAVCCYLDLDNLKAFNDYYGYAKADGVIRQTGDLVRDVVAKLGSPGDFIGHIAGDDFVLVASGESADRVCTAICDRFDQLIPLYYNRDDRARGYIEAKDRWGTLRRFPIMTVSIAAVSLDGLANFAEVAVRAADGKKLSKSLPGSVYTRDGHVVIGGDGAHPANDDAPSGPHRGNTPVDGMPAVRKSE